MQITILRKLGTNNRRQNRSDSLLPKDFRELPSIPYFTHNILDMMHLATKTIHSDPPIRRSSLLLRSQDRAYAALSGRMAMFLLWYGFVCVTWGAHFDFRFKVPAIAASLACTLQQAGFMLFFIPLLSAVAIFTI